ncbi:MAG: hypothetical protein C4583_02090 [Anaerolineaceae bacterium]|nr:MAG: hypothetical protein C4583_02090 [Anaerolineaceae bacterium]
MGLFKKLFGNKTDEINALAREGSIASIVKLIKMQGKAAKSGDIATLKIITSALKAHVPSELYIMAGETLPMNEQVEIASAVSKYRDVLS